MNFPSLTQGAQLLDIRPINEPWVTGSCQGVAFLFHFTGSLYGASVVSKQKLTPEGKLHYSITYGADCNQFEIAHIKYEVLPDVTNPDTFKWYRLTSGLDVVGHKEFWEVPEVLQRMQNRDFSDFAAFSRDHITDLTLRDSILKTVQFYDWSDHDADVAAHIADHKRKVFY